jgi:hypothetical protein
MMRKKIIYLLYFSFSFLYILFSDNLFQKGGVEEFQIKALFAMFFCSALLFTFHFRIKGIIKCLFTAIFISIIAFVCSIFINLMFIQILLGDKTWKLWVNPDKLIVNFIFFLSMILTEFTFFKLYKSMRDYIFQ